MDRRLLYGSIAVLTLVAFAGVASAQAPDQSGVPDDDDLATPSSHDDGGVVCTVFDVEDSGYPGIPELGCVVAAADKVTCDLILEDRPEYYTALDCVMHPADEAVCESLGEGHFHSKSATDCLVAFLTD